MATNEAQTTQVPADRFSQALLTLAEEANPRHLKEIKAAGNLAQVLEKASREAQRTCEEQVGFGIPAMDAMSFAVKHHSIVYLGDVDY